MDFDTLYKTQFYDLEKFCFKWTKNMDIAKDIAQESFTKLLQKTTSSALIIDNPKAWVYKVAYNDCINHIKFSKRFTPIETIANHSIIENTDKSSNTERSLQVQNALTTLNNKEKALIILYKYGFTYNEMAHVIEMNPASVGKTLTRAIDKIAKLINKI
ncbi:MAG: RNA polymerase sigma factor [Bacteroidales bacterium]